MTSTIDHGNHYERLASEYLATRGLKPLQKNYRSTYGEIDLVMRDGAQLVFVEVRYRASARFGGAASSVDAHKQQRLLKTAEKFLQETKADTPCRFDVIAISDEGKTINWLKDAFAY